MFDSAGKSDVLFQCSNVPKQNARIGELIWQREGGHAAPFSPIRSVSLSPSFSKSWNIGTKPIYLSIFKNIYIYKTNSTNDTLAKSITYTAPPKSPDSTLPQFRENNTNGCIMEHWNICYKLLCREQPEHGTPDRIS